jgi:hypothetical protein
MPIEQLERDSRITNDELSRANQYFAVAKEMLCPPIFRAAYSDRMAWIMASMAELAYMRFEDDPEQRTLFIAKLKSGGFELIKTFNSKETDTQAFLAQCDEYAVLAFRGTEVSKRQDVKTDIAAGKLSVLQGYVHKGFLSAYKSVADNIKNSLLELKDIPLYITGHSLGAALATVATQNLEHDHLYPRLREMVAACYTFGSPRVGNSHYEQEFKAPIYRVVNTTDVVTTIPLLAMGYMHIGDVRYLGAHEGEFSRGIPVFRRGLMFILSLFKLLSPIVMDHGIAKYRSKLERIAEKRNDLRFRGGAK